MEKIKKLLSSESLEDVILGLYLADFENVNINRVKKLIKYKIDRNEFFIYKKVS